MTNKPERKPLSSKDLTALSGGATLLALAFIVVALLNGDTSAGIGVLIGYLLGVVAMHLNHEEQKGDNAR